MIVVFATGLGKRTIQDCSDSHRLGEGGRVCDARGPGFGLDQGIFSADELGEGLGGR